MSEEGVQETHQTQREYVKYIEILDEIDEQLEWPIVEVVSHVVVRLGSNVDHVDVHDV